DHNLPLMLWYGVEPLATGHRWALADLAKGSAIPLVRNHIARRLALDPEDPEQAFDGLIRHAATAPEEWTLDILAGLSKSLEGISTPKAPSSWTLLSGVIANSANPEMVAFHRSLGTLFRDPAAINATRAVVADETAVSEARIAALRTLTTIRDPGSLELAKGMLGKQGLHAAAVERLAVETDPSVAALLLQRLPSLSMTDKTVAIDSLISRPGWASLLIGEVASGKLPADSLSPYQVRQIRSLKIPELAAEITRLWGERKDASKQKIHAANVWKLYLTPKNLSQADKVKGKEIYAQYCGTCHKMYGEGGTVGPELTGGGRDNLDYLLANILDPSEVVAKENQLSIITMKDGRTLSGMIRASDDRTTTLQTLAEKLTLPTADIAKTETLPTSLMPEGLIDSIPREQVRDLIGWLMDKGR
ncbi:MAG: c-type cytochrome, partial [Verrucomicrobiaceae bacterium]